VPSGPKEKTRNVSQGGHHEDEKTIASALIAVAVLAGVVAAASADPYSKKFFEQLDRGKY
jgi:hypothetical protein